MSDGCTLALPGSGAAPRPKPLRVLIADDDRDCCASLEALLHHEGHSTCCVFNGADVRGRLADFGPDVVLLDIGMPGMTGYDVARDLRARYGSAKPVLIAVTAYGKSADKLMAKAAGIEHHFQKPYDPRALLALLAKIGAGA